MIRSSRFRIARLSLAAAAAVPWVVGAPHSSRPYRDTEPDLPSTACDARRDDRAMSSLLDCMRLFPVPDLPSATGAIALLPPPAPFGVAVTADGRPRYHLSATIAGLP